MPARHLAAALPILLIAILADTPTSGQGKPKSAPKPKPGAPLIVDPNDLPKPGTPLSPWALVQRPPAIKNARAWSIETKRHRAAVGYLAVRPDGKKVATSGADGIVRIWDATTSELERALLGHEIGVSGVAWSPDGKYLASAGYYSARVWDAATGLPVRILKGKLGVRLVAWSPDGTKLLTGGGGSGGIALWDVAAGKQLAETEYGTEIASIAYCPTGDRVATAATRAGTYIAETDKLKTVHAFKDAADPDAAVAFSPDGKLLAAGTAKQIVLYDSDSGTVSRKLPTPGLALAWTPKGGLLAVGTGYQVIPFVAGDLSAGKPLPGVATALSLAADGTHLFGVYSFELRHWDLDKGAVVQTVPVAEELPLACGASPIVLVLGAEPALWDATSGKRISGLEGHTGGVAAFGWAPNGKFLAVAGAEKSIRVYDPPTGKLLRTLKAPAAVSFLAVAADGRVAVATTDRKVTLWAPTGDHLQQTLEGHQHPPRYLAWSRDGRHLATADGKDVFVWAAETGKQLKALDHPRDVYGLIWSLDSKHLFAGSSEEVALAAYQGPAWKLQPAIDRGTAALAAVPYAWSPDGATLLGYRSSAIQQWNAKTGKLGPGFGSIVGATTLAFSPDGKTIQGGCQDRAARYWDTSTGRLRLTVVADRNELVAIGTDGNCRIAETAEPEMIAVVMTDKAQDTMPIKDLATKYGHRNVPGNVK